MNRPHTSPIISILAAAACACTGFGDTASAAELIAGRVSDGLVFVVETSQGMDLWRARISDGALQRISATPDQDERWPAWSESAKRVMFTARRSDGFMTSQVRILDISKGDETGLGPEPDLVQRAPVWSPDGKYIVHTFKSPSSRTTFVTTAGAAVAEVGKTLRVIVAKLEELEQEIVHLDYSNDGTMILANGRNDLDERGDKLWILKPSKAPRQLHGFPRGIYTRPRFTRDGKKIVFSHQTNRSQQRDVMLLDIDSKARATRIARHPAANDYFAVPSPTRDEIVFLSDRDGNLDLFRVDLAGGPPVNLTQDSKDAETSPVWSPDGERVAYVVVPANQAQAEKRDRTEHKVRVMDRSGKILFETSGAMPSWMPPWTGDLPLSPGIFEALVANAKAEPAAAESESP